MTASTDSVKSYITGVIDGYVMDPPSTVAQKFYLVALVDLWQSVIKEPLPHNDTVMAMIHDSFEVTDDENHRQPSEIDGRTQAERMN